MAKPTTASVAEARAWLLENGHSVASRGRLPADLAQIFETRTKRSIV